MLRDKRKRTVPDFKKFRKSMTIPSQTMSVSTIIDRFTRNLPIGVIQREAVYIDQGELDLEKLGRLDFPDRAFKAQELKAESDWMRERLQADEQEKNERERKRREALKDNQNKGRQGPGIDTLDNTMPNDTSKTTK